MGKDLREHEPQRAVAERAAIVLFDVFAGVINEVHIVHPRRTGRHARQTGKTPVDVLDRALVGNALVFEHVLDEVYPPARAIELVPQEHKRRTRCRAESAMHAIPENFLGMRGLAIGKLRRRKVRLHYRSSRMRPRFRVNVGSKLRRTRADSAASGGG